MPWSAICSISSSTSKEGNKIIDTPNYFNWITFLRHSSKNNNYPRVISYINICLSHLYFSLCKDIFNHRDICCFSFFNNGDIFFIINIYSDNNQSALKYLKDTEAKITNVLIITGDFNIRDSNWDNSYPFYSVHSNILLQIADSFNLSLSSSVHYYKLKTLELVKWMNLVLD